ncbi:S66 family peptidase [Halobacillus litoralis]|uniref:LD-carboxypeptidase n=1 Tax=Halobacillus litoralis TaxID=45668 RepID=A0A410MAP4_9BACI|nr:S66 peptidase family protein [Halobacillus litoralis]QAS51750.1 LD-carboxypeptidase [Halobacillus litoralis]
MYPAKLKKGDEIRVISPSKSLAIIAADQKQLGMERLESLGFKVTFSKYADEDASSLSNPITHRIADLHEAFRDSKVKAILTTIGGFDSNQLLKHIDYRLIQDNPKIFCGFSDITALSNSIYSKTGLITFSGPHFSSFGMEKGIDYTFDYFAKMVTRSTPITIQPAEYWSDDRWYLDQENRTFHSNEGPRIINEGEAQGTIIGGNLCTLNLLQGTQYMPDLENTILFLEDDELSNPPTFDRDLQSLIHQQGFDKVKAIIIGRFQNASEFHPDVLKGIIHSKKELDHIPVISDANFGHTTPRFTFPIGGMAKVAAENGEATIEILEH